METQWLVVVNNNGSQCPYEWLYLMGVWLRFSVCACTVNCKSMDQWICERACVHWNVALLLVLIMWRPSNGWYNDNALTLSKSNEHSNSCLHPANSLPIIENRHYCSHENMGEHFHTSHQPVPESPRGSVEAILSQQRHYIQKLITDRVKLQLFV